MSYLRILISAGFGAASAYQNGRDNFISVMNGLSNDNRLVYILAGPVQVPYDYITAGPNNKEPFVAKLAFAVL